MKKELATMTLAELWHLFPIFLTEHQACWTDWYQEEKALLAKLLPYAAEFHHIGSTAIDNIMAKPIIDILVVVPSPAAMQSTATTLVENGYCLMATNKNRISLNKGYTTDGFAEKVFHLHLRLANDQDEIYFRDYLNQHRRIAKTYEQMKLQLWRKYEHDRDAYTVAKTDFVKKYTALGKQTAVGKIQSAT